MSDFEDDLVFDGSINGIKCASFIRFIRRRTLMNGTQRDDQLVADTAAASMDGAALRWFEDQDHETQDSWRLLRRALLQRWPDEETPDAISVPVAHIPAAAPAARPGNQTGFTPAAAAPPVPAMVLSNSQRLRGRIRVVAEKDGSPLGHLSRVTNQKGLFVASKSPEDAQIFSFTPTSKAADMYLELSTQAMLGITFDKADGTTLDALCDNLYKGSLVWGGLARLSRSGSLLQTSSELYNGISCSSVWHMSLDGEINLFCEVRPRCFCRLEISVGGRTGAIDINNNYEEYRKQNANSNQGRFLFELL